MTEAAYDLAQDLYVAKAMAASLDSYVRQDQLYYPLGAEFPRMTLGGFLLRLRRLHSLQAQLSPTQAHALQEVDASHARAVATWRHHYQQKLLTEVNSRQDVLRYYLAECEEGLGQCRENYPPEAHRRTILEELQHALVRLGVPGYAAAQDRLATLDDRLRALLEDGPFLWPEPLQSVYSAAEYWWLYAQPKPRQARAAAPR
ncbi:MAG: hypothetical protein HC915_16030 [Anaerolineae bacterium]|nr:hypothetical protein [Anaerolineae bacterium]